MSKLTDLISRLGQQAAQPIGFGALTGRAEANPTMALIGVTSASRVADDLDAIGRENVDAVVFSSSDDTDLHLEIRRSEDGAIFTDLIWGVVCHYMDNRGLEEMVSAGCDFLLADLESAPSGVVSYPDVALIIGLEEPVGRRTASALRSLGVAGSWNLAGLESLETLEGLIEVREIGESTGGVMLINGHRDMSVNVLTSLRDAGVDAVVTSLRDHDQVRELAKSIREMPPPRRPESRRFQAAAPRSSD